jgi:hypothetical protein
MPLQRPDHEPPVAEGNLETAASYDVMTLRRLTDHPWLQPLLRRRQELGERLRLLTEEHQRLEEALTRAEATAAEELAVLGADWSPAAYRQLKTDREEIATEHRMVSGAVALLDQQMEEMTSRVQDDIEVALNRLRKPLLDHVVQALATVVEANRQLHAIEALSQALLHHAKYHLYDASLPQRLALMQRTQHLLALAALGTDDAA